MPSPESMAFYYWCCLTNTDEKGSLFAANDELILDAVTWTKRKRHVAVYGENSMFVPGNPSSDGSRRGGSSLPDVFSFISCSVFYFIILCPPNSSRWMYRQDLPL